MEIKVQTDKKTRKDLRTMKGPGKKNILELDERLKPVHKETFESFTNEFINFQFIMRKIFLKIANLY